MLLCWIEFFVRGYKGTFWGVSVFFLCVSYVLRLFGRIIRINRVNNRRFCEEKEYFKSFERVLTFMRTPYAFIHDLKLEIKGSERRTRTNRSEH